MNTEEKAKAYDEALERAKKYNIDEAYASQGTVIKSIFPELRESEDEKRMRAIAVLEQQLHFWNYEGPIDKIQPATKRKDLIEAIDVALSYLEKQKEQESAEWSEEDEAMIKSILVVLASYVSHSESVSASSPSLITSYPTYYKEIDWLKSLRPQPHWKPNEEQIMELSYASNVMWESESRRKALKSLYNDLLKLM